jgi:hypothetical protein
VQRIGLHQHTLQFNCLQQQAQGLDLATGIGGVGGLGNRRAQRLGAETHLGDKPRCAGVVPAIEPRSVLPAQTRVSSSSDIPGWAATQSQSRLSKSGTSNCASRRRNVESDGDLQKSVPSSFERLPVPLGESLHPHQRALPAEDRKDRQSSYK